MENTFADDDVWAVDIGCDDTLIWSLEPNCDDYPSMETTTKSSSQKLPPCDMEHSPFSAVSESHIPCFCLDPAPPDECAASSCTSSNGTITVGNEAVPCQILPDVCIEDHQHPTSKKNDEQLEPTPISDNYDTVRLVKEIKHLPQEITKYCDEFIAALRSTADSPSRNDVPSKCCSSDCNTKSDSFLPQQHARYDDSTPTMLLETEKSTNETQQGTGAEESTTTESTTALIRIHPYQNERWMDKYNEILNYLKIHGHCNVPHIYSDNPALGQWVKRQRHQYRLYSRGDHSHLNADRIKLLEDRGFVWDSHGSAWEEKYEELKEFKRTQGHCTVPCRYKGNPKLSTWIKRQRRQYRLFVAGKQSTITTTRIAKLEEIGFVWDYYKDPSACRSPFGRMAVGSSSSPLVPTSC